MKNLIAPMTRIMAAALIVLLFGSFRSASNKITICHIPPGNPGNCHEICISVNALAAHLSHNDTFYCTGEGQYNDVMDQIMYYNNHSGAPSPVVVVKLY
jgi:hypothetical protein